MLIGVISDTHGLLRLEALDALTGVEHIIHAGDIGSSDIVPQLAEIAPVTAIRGNVDTQAWAQAFAPREVVALAGRTIYVIHDLGDLDLDPAAAGFDMVVSGHSHMPKVETRQGVVYLNPGSAGPRRFKLPITLAMAQLTPEDVKLEIRDLVAL
jgi:putative phosphoesterase